VPTSTGGDTPAHNPGAGTERRRLMTTNHLDGIVPIGSQPSGFADPDNGTPRSAFLNRAAWPGRLGPAAAGRTILVG